MKRLAFLCGLLLSLFVVGLGIVGLTWAPALGDLDLGSRLLPPDQAHWLGTDHLGRDGLGLAASGAATSVGIAAAAVCIALALGGALGFLIAMDLRWADLIRRAWRDLALVLLPLPLLIVATVNAQPGGPVLMLAFGLYCTPLVAGAVAHQARMVQAHDFARVAGMAGLRPGEVFLDHALPHLLRPLVALLLTLFAGIVLGEIMLSYAGLGVQPPTSSLGLMLREAQPFLATQPALAAGAGLFAVVVALGPLLMALGLCRGSLWRLGDGAA